MISSIRGKVSISTNEIKMKYPPPLSDDQLHDLITEVKDWQLTHGSLLKLLHCNDQGSVLAHSIGASLFPTLFPRILFEEALSLQRIYNKLYTAVAEDDEWLFETLEVLIKYDMLADTLWGIHKEVKKEGYIQDLTLGIFRSDYMLHVAPEFPQSSSEIQLKQVEFNTFSCAGGVHGNKISDMHRYLHHTGAYQPQSSSNNSVNLPSSSLPPNNTLSTIIYGISAAHKAYGPPKFPLAKQTCILMVVQPNNFNIADERPIQYALTTSNPPIPTFRVLFTHALQICTFLTASRELIYHPPHRPALEVSVVYFRAGLDVEEYDDVGREIRFMIEKSRAIKCPSILGHLTTFKKVQQELTIPGVLERWLSVEEARRVRASFGRLWPMEGLEGRRIVGDKEMVGGFVLKPSLEGGGHNVYGEAIPGFLAEVDAELWGSYVLMEKIRAPGLKNVLISTRGLHEGNVVSELGVFGVCLWKRGRDGAEMVGEWAPSWSFKTKDRRVDEMSVVKGYGCFDSPALVESEVFEACCQKPDGK